MRRNNMRHHGYSDDSQLYLFVRPSESWRKSMDSIESCIKDIIRWMYANMLQLNTAKTEVIIFQPKSLLLEDGEHLSIAGSAITPSNTVRNLRVM